MSKHMFEAMYAVMIRMKLIKYSTVGLLSLSLLLSHSVPTKAEMHNMASKGIIRILLMWHMNKHMHWNGRTAAVIANMNL